MDEGLWTDAAVWGRPWRGLAAAARPGRSPCTFTCKRKEDGGVVGGEKQLLVKGYI